MQRFGIPTITERTEHDKMDDVLNRFEPVFIDGRPPVRRIWPDDPTTPSKDAPTPGTPTPSIPTPIIHTQSIPNQVTKLANDVERIVRAGLQPLYATIGMLAVRLGDRDTRSYYKWKDNTPSLDELQLPIVREANTVPEFVQKNVHLGKPLLKMVLRTAISGGNLISSGEKEYHAHLTNSSEDNSIDAALIGANPVELTATDESFIQQMLDGLPDPQGGNVNLRNFWVFSIIDYAVFEFVLSGTSLGAMGLALSYIRRIPNCARFTLKQLMMSEGVRDIFALLVAYQYLMASGGNAYAGRANISSQGRLNNTNMMLSAGYRTRAMLASQVETSRYWFARVFAVPNPLIKELENSKDGLVRIAAGQAMDAQDDVRTWVTTVNNVSGDPSIGLQRILKNKTLAPYNAQINAHSMDYIRTQLKIETIKHQLSELLPTILKHYE